MSAWRRNLFNHIGASIKSIKQFVKYLLSTLVPECIYAFVGYVQLDPGEKRFVKFCRQNFRQQGKKHNGVILVDIFYIPEALIAYAYFLNALKLKTGFDIKHFIYGHGLISPKVAAVYRSFNSKSALRILLNKKQKERAEALYQQILKNIKSKDDVYNIKIDGIHIGIDVYESYLRDFNQPTVDIHDPRLFTLLSHAINLTIFWDDFFANNKVGGYVTSHDVYVWMNIGCKLAYKHKVPVYLPNNRNINCVTEPFSIYSHFKQYPTWFKAMSPEKQSEAIALAESRLKTKLSGELTIEMHYATASGYGQKSTERVLSESNNIKVLIASHCFFDNPHAYNELMFTDFYEWLIFLGEISNKTSYDWYLKVHPDPLPGTEEIIKKILTKYSKIKLINYKTSHHQLIEEGIDFVLTCYGTIGEEYPLMGAQVINTSYNPRIAYNFNWHAKDKADYERLLLNLPNLKLNVDKKEVYEFYYMNYYYTWVDNIIFNSYRQYLSDFKGKNRISGLAFDYFLDELTEDKNKQITSHMIQFIDSKKTSFFELVNQGNLKE